MAKIDLDKTKTAAKTTEEAYTELVGKKTTSASSSTSNSGQFIFTNDNWKWVLIGLGLIAIGFILMAGGKSADPHVFNEKEIYSARRIIVAPLLVVAGFVVEIYAILKKNTASS